MSTKIGIIAEGVIDQTLLSPLLERIAHDRAGYGWPVDAEDMAEVFHIRKRGHGGVLKTVERLLVALNDAVFDHAFFVIVLDRRTLPVQEQIRALLPSRDRFVVGTAIQEIEAWWLGDRENTLDWAGLKNGTLPSDCRYGQRGYRAERDDNPKRTLDDLTIRSEKFDRCYGQGNVDLAAEFAEEYWRSFARLDDIRRECPKGYGPFERATTQRFRTAMSRPPGRRRQPVDGGLPS